MVFTPTRRRKAVPRSLRKFTRAVRNVDCGVKQRDRATQAHISIASRRCMAPISDNLRREGQGQEAGNDENLGPTTGEAPTQRRQLTDLSHCVTAPLRSVN